MNKPNLQKLKRLKDAIAAEKGMFSLFAITQRKDGVGKWDIVIAAPWITSGNLAETRYVVDKIARIFTGPERVDIAQIVLLRPDEPVVDAILAAGQPSDGMYRSLHEVDINGMVIRGGYILP